MIVQSFFNWARYAVPLLVIHFILYTSDIRAWARHAVPLLTIHYSTFAFLLFTNYFCLFTFAFLKNITIKTLSYIQGLIEQGENQQLDFKFGITDSKKIAHTLSSFSNTDGGILLIGVKDNGSIAGVRSDEEFYMVEAAAQMYCKPAILFDSKSHPINQKTILEIIIHKYPVPPVLAPGKENKWTAYIRVRDENIVASRVLMKYWSKKKDKEGLHIELTKVESMLLNYLENNESISILKFTRLAQVSREHAEHILAEFMVMGLIKMEVEGNNIHYILKR